METETTLDPRTDAQKTVDEAMGAVELTTVDRMFAPVLKAANDLFMNARATKKYLVLAEHCDAMIRKSMDNEDMTRAQAVSRIAERLADAGISNKDVRVNDWLAVYGLAKLCTGEGVVKNMPDSWVGAYAYRTLAILKVAVSRDDTEYAWKDGWQDKVRELLRRNVRGDALEEAVKAHAEYVDAIATTTKRASLSPERQHLAELAELAKVKDAQIAKIKVSLEGIRKQANDANLSAGDLQHEMVKRGVIPAPTGAPMDVLDMARSMDSETAHAFALALVERNNLTIIMAITSILVGHQKLASVNAA